MAEKREAQEETNASERETVFPTGESKDKEAEQTARMEPASGSVKPEPLKVRASDSVEVKDDGVEPSIDENAEVRNSQHAFAEGAPPIPPSRELLFETGATIVYACLTDQQRFLPATGIVVPVGVRGGLYGNFAKSLQGELDPSTWDRVANGVKEATRSGIRVDRPVPVVLDPDIVREVLPNAPLPPDDGVGYIIAATAGGAEEPEDLRAAAEEIVLQAARIGIRYLTIVPLGTSRGPFKDLVEDVASQMVIGVWIAVNYLPAGSITEITLATRDADFIAAARNKVHVITRNRPQAIQNDEPAAEDLIGIRFEANALAETVLLQDTEVPLAVGILGGWGSGKSTVMRLMQKKMTEIRTQVISRGWADDPGNGELSDHVGHIYQIRFNAWTYAKSNLWASLMQTIFTEMNRQLSCEKSLSEIREAMGQTPQDSGLEFQYLFDEYGWIRPGYWNLLPTRIQAALRLSSGGNRLWMTLSDQQREALVTLQDKQEEIATVRKTYEEIKTSRQKRVIENLTNQAQQSALAAFKQKANAALGETSKDIVSNFVKSTDGNANAQIEEILTGMRSIRTSWNQIWSLIKENPGAALIIILLCVGIIVGTVAAALSMQWSAFETYLSTALSLIPLLLVAVRATVPLARRVGELAVEYPLLEEAEIERILQLEAGEMAKHRASDEEAADRIMFDPELNNEQKREKLKSPEMRNNLVAHEYREQLLEVEVEALRQQIGPTARYDSLLEFVQARLDDKAYEKELGLMHRVRRDLDILTDGLVIGELDDETLKEKKRKLLPRGPARVVLFIDDLDRCPPRRVVEVFEAVQLLLSTKLFVVVLGLDTRYVTKALEEAYKHILQAGGDPSGLDYIEKIVQIPYRVRKVGHGGVGRLLASLMEVLEEEPSSEEIKQQEEVTMRSTVESGIVSEETRLIDEPPLSGEAQPEKLQFLPEDRIDLEACCRQLQLTPRSIKRMVNVLRLLVVYWIRRLGHQYGTETNRPIKRAIIGLLALAAAYPEIMREIFVELDVLYRTAAKTMNKSIGELLVDLVQEPKLSFLPEWQVERFSADVVALQDIHVEDERRQTVRLSFFKLTLDQLNQDNLNLVRSFSFVGDPTYSLSEGGGKSGSSIRTDLSETNRGN